MLIYLADTGLLPDPGLGHPWLAGVRMGNAAEDEDTGGSQTPIPPYTAHGTFTAGVTRCMAPAADIIVTNAFKVAGSTLESDLVPRLVGALGHGVDIFHLIDRRAVPRRSAADHVRGVAPACCGSTRARCASPRQETATPGGHAGRARSTRWSRWARWLRDWRSKRLVQQLRRVG